MLAITTRALCALIISFSALQVAAEEAGQNPPKEGGDKGPGWTPEWTNIDNEAQEQYTVATGLFGKQYYEEAIREYRKFLDKWPKSDRADPALFRIAESNMLLRQYGEALKDYGAYLAQYPKGEYVEQAQFRLA
ncbi:MAG: hypothetical protein COZ06_07180, partial [Armatimonadetes bacterium CG_4_10_14_3_um_filter_66_18]